jgi:hypothetical protein
MFGKKTQPAPTRRDVLKLRPQRNPNLEWSEVEDKVVLHIRHGRTWKTALLNIFMPVPKDRTVVLDTVGTDVWKAMDGQTTFETIAKLLAQKHKLTPREAELSLQQFFKELGRRGYVVFRQGS